MASLPSLFRTFLSNIRPTDHHIEGYKGGHETLRSRLQTDDHTSEFYVGDFLQGSDKRSTAVKPIGREKSDVDIIFVTDLDKRSVSPREAMQRCEPFLDEYYAGQWEQKNRPGRTILCPSIFRFSFPPRTPLHRDPTQSVLCLLYCLREAIPPWEQVGPLRTRVPTCDERIACFLLGYSRRHHR